MSKPLYFIAILPPVELRARVLELKLEMKRRFAAGHALKSPAHITLQMPFRLEEEKEGELCKMLQRFVRWQFAFEVQLCGFDCFPPRVIFLKVTDHCDFIPLRHSLKKNLIESAFIPEPEKQFPFHPHMTIATRDLTETAFKEAWPEYAQRRFYAEFRAQSLYLLKHNGRHWDIFSEFLFEGK